MQFPSAEGFKSVLNISVKDCSSCKCDKFKTDFTAVGGWQVKRSLDIIFALSCPNYPALQCTQKLYPTWWIPELGILGEVLGDRRAVYWVCLCWGCSDSIAVMPDGLRRFASSRSLGLGFSHVRDVVGTLSGLSKGIEGQLSLAVCSWAIPPFCFASISKFVNIPNASLHGQLELIPPSCLCCENPRQQVWHICPAIANRNCSVNTQMVGKVTCCWIRAFLPPLQVVQLAQSHSPLCPNYFATNR